MIEDKFCVTLSENNFTAYYQAAKDAKLAELRLDLVHLSEPELKKLFGLKTKFIATYRSEKTNEAKRKDLLKKTIDLGADYIDVEIDSNPDFQKEILGYAKEKKCQNAGVENGAHIRKLQCPPLLSVPNVRKQNSPMQHVLHVERIKE